MAKQQVKTEAELAEEVKSRHKEKSAKGIFCLKVEDKTAWLRSIDRKVVSMASTVGGDDPVLVAEIVLDNCWLEGDEEIRSDDDYFLPAVGILKSMVAIKTAELKKY